MDTAQRIKELTRPTGEEDLMKVDYPAPRVSVPPKQAAAAVTVVGLLALLGFGWSALGRGSSSDDWPTPQWSAAGEPSAGATTQPHTASDHVVVAVVGAVSTPGLVTLEPGARVADALAAAHPLPEADLASVNLAQPLVDGQQIQLLARGEAPPFAPGAPGTPAHAGRGISLNSASATELTQLPGIGEATAAAIVAHRESHGPFTSVDQLTDVKGIGPAKFEAIKDLATL